MDTTERKKKIEFLLAKEEKARRANAAPLFYWKPHPRQRELIEAFKNYRIVIGGGGNRSGKTTVNTAIAICFMYGYWIFDVPNLKLTTEGDYPPRSEVDPAYWIRRPDHVPIRHPCRCLIVTGQAMQKGVGATLWPAIENFLPVAVRTSADLKVQRGPYSVPVRFELPNGSEAYFGSAEQDAGTFESVAYDFVAADEPLPRRLFGGIWRGMIDHFARLFISMTPLGANSMFLWEKFMVEPRKDVKLVQMSIHDNPHLSRDAVAEAISEWSPDERQARESGAWQFLSHRAFPQFDPAAHVIAPFVIPPEWDRYCVIDPAHRRPFAIVWMAFGPNEEVVVYREFPEQEHHKINSSTLTVHDYSSIIRNLEGNERIAARILDPRFGAAHHRVKGQITTSIQEDFATYGLQFDCRIDGTEREETGIEEIRRLLRWDSGAPLSAVNRPKLQVFTHCVNSINSLSMSNYVPPEAKDPSVLPEKLLASFKDFRDCIRYGVLYPRPYTGSVESLAYINYRDLDAHNDFGRI